MAVTTVVPERACESPSEKFSFETYEDMQADAVCITQYFPWPIDRQPDTDRYIDAMFEEKPAQMQAGGAYLVVDSMNKCVWYHEWIDARLNGDTSTASAALQMIVYQIPNYPKTIPGFPAWLFAAGSDTNAIDLAKSAQLGDPGPIQDYVEQGGCASIDTWVRGGGS